MATIRHEIVVNASPQHIWDVIRDIAAVHERLLPGRVADTRVDRAERFLTFPDGHVIRELIITIDDAMRRLAYAVVEGARPRLDYHHASFEVHDEGERGRLVWTTDVLPDTAAPEVRIRTEFGLSEMKRAIEAAELGVHERGALERADRHRPSDDLIDGGDGAILLEKLPLVRVFEDSDHTVADGIASGLIPRDSRQNHEVPEFE